MALTTSQLQIIPTPSPTEVMIRLVVPDRIIQENMHLTPTGSFLELYTPYKNVTWVAVKPRVQDFGDYLYVKSEKPGEDTTALFFGKPKTNAEKNTPFRVYSDTHDYVWPAVLLDQYILKSNFPITTYTGSTTDSATRYFQRFRFVNATPYNSIVKIRQYLSTTPWDERELQHIQPVPTPINGAYLGLPINIPRCLHRRLTLPELVPGASIVLGAGMEGSDRFGTPKAQIFPATNFSTWVPFFMYDKQQMVNGIWLRESAEIFPPPQGEATQQ
jgi:hypothetical protein